MSAYDQIQRVSHTIKRRTLTVLKVVDITPRMRRVTLGGEQLEGFVSLGSDDHIKLLFPRSPEEQEAIDNFVPGAANDGPKPLMRDYTPRRHDLSKKELDIDFVLHGDGPAATWAAQAVPGQRLSMAGPRGSLVVPQDLFNSYLLIGDETALPAIGRRLDELSSRCRVLVVAEIEDEGERQQWQSQADVDVRWVVRGHEDLLAVVSGLELPGGQLYAWVATEAALSRKVRRVLLDEHGLVEAQVKASGYWQRDKAQGEA